MSVRLQELSSIKSEEDLRRFLQELTLTIEQEFDRIDDELDTSRNLSSESLVSVTGDYLAGQDSIILVDSSSGPITVTLPPADTIYRGKYTIKKISTDFNSVEIKTDGGLIENSPTYTLPSSPFPSISLVSDGTGFWIISMV